LSPAPDEAVFGWDDSTLRRIEEAALRGLSPFSDARQRELFVDLQAKKWLATAARVANLLARRQDGRAAAQLRAAALGGFRASAEACVTADRTLYRITVYLFGVVVAFALAAPTLTGLWSGNSRGWSIVPLTAGNILALLLAAAAFVAIQGWRTIARIGVLFLSVVLMVGAVALGVSSPGRPLGLATESAVAFSASGLALLAAGVLWVMALDRNSDQRGITQNPDIDVLMEFVRAVSNVDRWQRGVLPEAVEIRSLERGAQRVWSSYRRLRGNRDPDVAAWASRQARGISAVLRRHKVAVMEVPDDRRGEVTSSLLNGVRCLLAGDWAALLVVEPEPLRRSLLQRYGSRVALAGVLIAAAWALPVLLPNLIIEPDRFRATVLVTAVFSLWVPDVHKAADAIKSFSVKR
jgi:hypothetical protein